jgi:hypothetical protein
MEFRHGLSPQEFRRHQQQRERLRAAFRAGNRVARLGRRQRAESRLDKRYRIQPRGFSTDCVWRWMRHGPDEFACALEANWPHVGASLALPDSGPRANRGWYNPGHTR